MSNDIVENVPLDVDGYLLAGEDWNEDVAFELATASGINRLTEQHWAVVRALREGYVPGEPAVYPQVRDLCSSLGMAENCVTELFGDPAVAWRIAGLPKPATDNSAFMPSSDIG